MPTHVQQCAILFTRNSSLEPLDESGCMFPVGHQGPHQFRDPDGTLWQWETDWECDCDNCRQNDGDFCAVYWSLPNERAEP